MNANRSLCQRCDARAPSLLRYFLNAVFLYLYERKKLNVEKKSKPTGCNSYFQYQKLWENWVKVKKTNKQKTTTKQDLPTKILHDTNTDAFAATKWFQETQPHWYTDPDATWQLSKIVIKSYLIYNCIKEFLKTWIVVNSWLPSSLCTLKPSRKHRLGPCPRCIRLAGARVTDMPCHSHDSLKKLYSHVSLSPFTKT